MNNKIVVVGGGASGMMAAICAARRGAAVTLLEPNERLGKKLNITGKGRCNVTNQSNCEELMSHVAKNGRFLFSAFTRFDGFQAITFFEQLGVPLKVERGKRVFPVSDRSFDISGALEKELCRQRVTIVRDRAVSLRFEADVLRSVLGEKKEYEAGAVVLATGGVSYPATGSTGDGYRMAVDCGHTLIEPTASLVPLLCEDEDCREMQGLSLKNVVLNVKNEKGRLIFSELGEMLFTHFGITGPLVLSASAHMRSFEKESYKVSVDLKPALDEQKLEARLLRDFEQRSNQNFASLLGGLVNRSMVPVMCRRCGLDGSTKVNIITREQRHRLSENLKNFSLTVTGTRSISEAIITSGGIKVNEIDPKTMSSKLVEGLFFAGEIIDVDAYTGGFNLQIAWATGKAAGEAAAAYVQKV